MAFITHCLKRSVLRLILGASVLFVLCSTAVQAADTGDGSVVQSDTAPALQVERSDGALWLSAHFAFVLPAVVEDALLKGIPIYFVTQVDLMRQRWYWTDRTVASTQRRARLAFHPLTRRWRLSLGATDAENANQGLSLHQNYDSLTDAMAAVRRVARWKVADIAGLEPGAPYRLDFKFELDTTELPRPLQIGTLGQSDWMVSLSASQKLQPELTR